MIYAWEQLAMREESSMDSAQAKKILALYRPGDTNYLDARMAQALELARTDPQLAVWFGRHCAAQVRIPFEPEAAVAVATPPPLLPAVLPVDRELVTPRPKVTNVFFLIVFLALTAAVGWAWLLPQPQRTFASYRDRMARLVQRSYPMKTNATDQVELREYLRVNSGPDDFVLPKKLEKLPGMGAAVFTWNNQPVSLLGFQAGATNLYLFVARGQTFLNGTIPVKPQFMRVGQVMTATWKVGENVFLLTGPDDENVLRGYVNSPF